MGSGGTGILVGFFGESAIIKMNLTYGIKCLSLVLMAALLSACTAFGKVSGDLQKTWDRAIVRVPWSDQRISSNDLLNPGDEQVARFPVVLYLHGCTAFQTSEEDFGRLLASEGFVFIAPNSMARSYRPLQCDPETSTGGFNRFVFDFRMAEISYAVQQLQSFRWVDQEKLFLVGGSEGAVAAALYRGDEFKARVVFQWTCHGAPIVAGISGTAEPMLAIINRQDPWYDAEHTRGQTGDCGAFFSGLESSQSMVFDIPGVHSLFERPRVRRAIVDFLNQHKN